MSVASPVWLADGLVGVFELDSAGFASVPVEVDSVFAESAGVVAAVCDISSALPAASDVQLPLSEAIAEHVRMNAVLFMDAPTQVASTLRPCTRWGAPRVEVSVSRGKHRRHATTVSRPKLEVVRLFDCLMVARLPRNTCRKKVRCDEMSRARTAAFCLYVRGR